jgi:cobalamin biosynthesis protein CobT
MSVLTTSPSGLPLSPQPLPDDIDYDQTMFNDHSVMSVPSTSSSRVPSSSPLPQPLPDDIDYGQITSNNHSVMSVPTPSPSRPPSKTTTAEDLILKSIDKNLSHNTSNNRNYDDIDHSNLDIDSYRDIDGYRVPKERLSAKSISNLVVRNYEFKSCKQNNILREYGGGDGENSDCDGNCDDINDNLIGSQSINFYHYGDDDNDDDDDGDDGNDDGDDDNNYGDNDDGDNDNNDDGDNDNNDDGDDDGDNGSTVAYTSNKCYPKASIAHSRVVVYGKEMVLDSSEEEDLSTSSKLGEKRKGEF